MNRGQPLRPACVPGDPASEDSVALVVYPGNGWCRDGADSCGTPWYCSGSVITPKIIENLQNHRISVSTGHKSAKHSVKTRVLTSLSPV